MKSFIVFALFVAAAVAAPLESDAQAQVISQSLNNIGTDGFDAAYETSNGITAESHGKLVNAGAENAAVEVSGQYSYPGPDGVVYTVTYIADQLGFRAQGAHLPKSA